MNMACWSGLAQSCRLFLNLICLNTSGHIHTEEHRWFAGINWRLMADLRFEPPHIPRIKSKRDLSNFCPQSEDVPQVLDYDSALSRSMLTYESCADTDRKSCEGCKVLVKGFRFATNLGSSGCRGLWLNQGGWSSKLGQGLRHLKSEWTVRLQSLGTSLWIFWHGGSWLHDDK